MGSEDDGDVYEGMMVRGRMLQKGARRKTKNVVSSVSNDDAEPLTVVVLSVTLEVGGRLLVLLMSTILSHDVGPLEMSFPHDPSRLLSSSATPDLSQAPSARIETPSLCLLAHRTPIRDSSMYLHFNAVESARREEPQLLLTWKAICFARMLFGAGFSYVHVDYLTVNERVPHHYVRVGIVERADRGKVRFGLDGMDVNGQDAAFYIIYSDICPI